MFVRLTERSATNAMTFFRTVGVVGTKPTVNLDTKIYAGNLIFRCNKRSGRFAMPDKKRNKNFQRSVLSYRLIYKIIKNLFIDENIDVNRLGL